MGRFLALIAVCWATAAHAQSSSPSYHLQPVTVSAAGRAAAGSTVVAHGSLGQDSTVGASSSFHYVLQSGYWSVFGSTVVPVVLSVAHHAGDPAAVDLSWSGNNAPYSIYRATTPSAIYGGLAFALTSNNAFDDLAPPAGALACYSVLAAAPGPQPPPPDGTAP